MRPAFFNLRRNSLVRGSALVLGSLFAAFRLSDFPHNHPTLLITIPAILALLGSADTIRCMHRGWSLYTGGVLLLLYMDLMAFAMILFLLLYPYAQWITTTH